MKLNRSAGILGFLLVLSICVVPAVYVFGCANGVSPCTGTNRQAMNPLTGQFLGPNTTAAVGTLVAGSGQQYDGLFSQGDGIDKTGYTFPAGHCFVGVVRLRGCGFRF